MKRPINPWKLASLGFAVGIVVVSGTAAFEQPADAAPQVNKEALQALGMMEAANRHLWKAPKDPEGHRQKAFEAIKAAQGELRQLAFPAKKPPSPTPPPAPPPAPAAAKKK
jgi:hypothetical protein